ncbi:hypothetical protein Tco_0838596 [Tanacetum coccineum]|uniref:Uncharacterized protein n=1 Tax=Tanacetum coccineum TaxID=301880 RepID=A0ABQ5AT75_9ASTR
MDSEATDASTQQNPKQIDEEFTTTAYPNVQDNLKLPTEDQFFIEKPQEEEPKKTNIELEVQSMVTVLIHQETSSVPPMTSLVIDLTVSHPVSTTIHAPLPTSTATVTATTTTTYLPPPPQPQQSTTDPILVRCIGELEQHMADLVQSNLSLEERLDKHGSWLYKLENLNIPQQVSKAVDEIVTDVVDWAMQAPLRACFCDLPAMDMKDILQQRMFDDKSYEAHEDHRNLYDALQKSLERDYSNQLLADLDEARKKKIKRCASGAPGSAQQQGSKASSSSKTAASTHQSMAWTTSDTRHESTGFTDTQETSPSDDLMQDDFILGEQTIPSSNVSDVKNNWASALVSTYEPTAENSLLAKIGDMTTFMNWYCQKVNKTVLTKVYFKGQAYEVVKAFYPDVIHIQFQMEECHKMLTDQVDWMNPEGDQGSSPALSISKMKAASYPDFGLELLVPEQIHDSPSNRKEVRTHMRILSVVRIKAYSRYGNDYLSETVLQRVDLQEHTIAKKDFKNLYPSDFEDLNLLLLQGHLDHLPGSNKWMLSTVNPTKPGWDAKGYEFKHDYTIIKSPRAVVFPVDKNKRKIMWFNEIYKFSDGTLTRILEALDYRVKEFKIKQLNPGMNTQFWTQKDVIRSKEFIAAIERRLKTRRIYQNLECFVGGRIRDIDYRLLQRTE